MIKFKLNKNIYWASAVALLLSSCGQSKESTWVGNAVETAQYQLTQMAEEIKDAPADRCFPRSIRNGEIRLEKAVDWTSGFFPGNLWLGYELTGDKNLAAQARKFTNRLESLQYYGGTHDLGFMVYCSYGQGERLAPEEGDKEVIINASKSLCSRYSPVTKTIRSWDFGDWDYPVIIDNMMNLEMLFWASNVSGDGSFRDIAITHANTTLEQHFREDATSYHVISYKQDDGSIESKGTFQGYSDDSAWARGQAWGLYGYTMSYRFTKDEAYLKHAERIAAFIMSNKPAADDFIPYWDYNAPNIPDAPRDASAAAVTASALLELQGYVADGTAYFEYAENILKQLSSPAYLAEKGGNKGFILLHSVGHLPANSEIDTPLNYADYYYLESLLRYKALTK